MRTRLPGWVVALVPITTGAVSSRTVSAFTISFAIFGSKPSRPARAAATDFSASFLSVVSASPAERNASVSFSRISSSPAISASTNLAARNRSKPSSVAS